MQGAGVEVVQRTSFKGQCKSLTCAGHCSFTLDTARVQIRDLTVAGVFAAQVGIDRGV